MGEIYMDVKHELDKQHEDFRYLSDQEIRKLQEKGISHTYKKGQVLYDFDDDRLYMYFLVSGVIRFEKIDDTGTFHYLQFKKAKNLFPYMDLFSNNSYFVSAVAHTDIEVILIPTKLFEEILSNNTQQLIYALTQQTKLLQTQILKVQKGILNNTNYRVTTTLAIIYKELGEKQYPQGHVTVPCPITINDLARSSGTTRETTSTVIKKLVVAKKINYHRKYITFLDTKFFHEILYD